MYVLVQFLHAKAATAFSAS